tara:strand:- start:1133 stop:1342 length:210 start_codon:yes stop_codon:yes gene_type:complete
MIKKHYLRELKWNYGNRNLYGIVQYSLNKKIKSFKYIIPINPLGDGGWNFRNKFFKKLLDVKIYCDNNL